MVHWLADDVLDLAIRQLQQHAQAANLEADARRARNVVDPFSSLLIASTFGISEPSSLEGVQRAESSIRGLSNALGEFHQRVLGSVAGWVNHDAGYDLECAGRQIVAEVKNKWNTMNAPNRRQVETGLAEAVRQKRGVWTAYLVLVVPKKPVRYTKELVGLRNVVEIDGASFYHLVTGDPNALHDLFDDVSKAIATSEGVAEYCRRVVADSLPPREGTAK